MTADSSKDILTPIAPIDVGSSSSNEMSGGTDLTNTAENDFENYLKPDVDKGISAENKLSEIEENKLLDYIGKLYIKDERLNNSQYNLSQNPKASAKVTGKRVQNIGKVITVLQEKKFGFIRPDNGGSSSEPKLSESGKREDVYFKLDSVRGYLFSLKKNDIVQYTVIQGKNNKISAVNVTLLKAAPRQCSEISEYLIKLQDELINPDKNVAVIAAQIVGTPVIWQHLSEMISSEKMDDLVVFDFLRVLVTVEKTTKSLDESISQLFESVTTQSFFNPFRGKLKNTIKETNNEDHLKLVQDFLLTMVKNVPNKAQPVIRLIKPIVEKSLPGAAEFSYNLLKTVARFTPGNIGEMDWSCLPLTMTNEEVHSLHLTDDMNLQPVIRQGPYDSPEEYMETYFRLLRTDCFFSLKQGINNYLGKKLDPRDMNVYVNVILGGIDVTNNGLYVALRVKPMQKVRDWEKSSYLMFGNLLCLSAAGNFNDVIWATVADRRLLKTANMVVVQFCSEFSTARVGEIISSIIGTGLPMVMVESPTYYRAFQPVLKAMQAIQPDELSFVEELVTIKQNPCKLFNTSENIDASLVYRNSPRKILSLQKFIAKDHSEDHSIFDKSQEKAVKQALVNSIGIIQGPPGTGKSFIGVQMLRILLSMPSLEHTKVLIITYKNHALDEFTKDVLKYFPGKVVRIGGGSRDEALDKISLKTLKREGNKCYDFMDAKNSLYEEINVLRKELENAFDAMDQNSRFSYSDVISQMSPKQQLYLIKNCDWNKYNLKSFGILKDESDGYTTQKNKKKRNINTVTNSEVAFILKNVSENTYVNEFKKLLEYSFKIWVPDDQSFLNAETRLTGNNNSLARTNINKFNAPSDKEIKKDDAEENNNFLDKKESKELEEERIAAISGSGVKRSEAEVERNIHERKMPKKSPGSIAAFSRIASKKLLNEEYHPLINRENLWDLEPEERALFIQYCGAIQCDTSCSEFETKVSQFEDKINQLAEINNTITTKQLEDKQIFAMTITGASIHNNLLSNIRPEIIIIEEAAEILEPQLVAAMGSWTKYMLLIGDHYQLRPSVETYELKTKFNFDISMMERLINNNMNYSSLEIQNRQKPEMAKLLLDIYPDLKTNMERVANNHQAKCLTQSSFFWNHNFPEKKERSVTNPDEGERVVMLALFLLQQGYSQDQITILATYNGQVSLLRKLLKEKFDQHHKDLELANKSIDTDEFIKVHTVDMFQGDENDFVIISLVRSNAEHNIGFLKERNRRCVAQSRARCGVYFVGNSSMFFNKPTWSPMMKHLYKDGRIGDHLEIKCQYHPLQLVKVTKITLDCFCKEPCTLIMHCKKHPCSKTCHPLHGHAKCSVEVHFTHVNCGHTDIRKCFVEQNNTKCRLKINFRFLCGHASSRECHEKEDDKKCEFKEPIKLPCGHTKVKKCFQNVNDIKCDEICALKLKCNHLCQGHKCHEHASIKKCLDCEKIRKVEAEQQRKAEKKLRENNYKTIDEEIIRIKKAGPVKMNEAQYEELSREDSTEYLDVEDYVKKYVQPTHRWFPRVTRIIKVRIQYSLVTWVWEAGGGGNISPSI